MASFRNPAPLVLLVLAVGCRAPAAPIPDRLDDGWPVAAPADVGLEAAVLERIDSLRDANALGVLNAVVVVRDGRLVFERYYPSYRTGPPPLAETLDGMVPNRPFPPLPDGPLTAATVPPHTFQSASKGVTALVVGAAVDRGLLAPDRPVADLLPRYAGLLATDPRKGRMTLRHVLTMTTGLDWDETAVPYHDPANLARRLNASADWVGFTLGQPMREEPGTRFEYCSGCTLLLSAILQQATGKHADEFAEEALFRPLGIERTVWIRHAASADSLSHTGGGLWLRPRDAAKLGWLFVSGGEWGGRRVLSREWLEETARSHNERGEWGYGFQWNIRAVPGLAGSVRGDLLIAWGAAGQFIFVARPLRMVVVVNGYNWGDDLANPAFGTAVLRTAVAAASGAPR
jgi:CubicO group peptidase (beta-lactamase class C family)